jgi:hypothetical protein
LVKSHPLAGLGKPRPSRRAEAEAAVVEALTDLPAVEKAQRS